ncbi:GntR family transcriptional regulator [Kitasatospora kazusensis]|uniref:GntR family transcriptional regulator n=1 Tax=Kitasatospora kazusensis TaxID=407974 RepID=A0ABP5KHZ3_9ACTN
MTPESTGTTEPPYLRIVAEIRRRVAVGELRPGDRVPSTRGITREFGVAMATATKVLTALRQEGLVLTRTGVGTVVAEAGPAAAAARAAASVPAPVAPVAPAPAALATPAGPEPAASGRTRRSGVKEREQGLSRDRIVRAAIDVADTEGLAALSMRRVATELGVATMALYRHVQGKDELVLLMVDSVLGEEAYPEEPPEGWRAMLELGARLQWRVFRRHPWLAPIMSVTRPVPSPNAMVHSEWAVRALADVGFDPATKLYTHILLFSFVRGIAVNVDAEVQAERETGMTDEQWMESQGRVLEWVMSSGHYPEFGRLLGEVGEFDFDLDTLFELGLRRMLDGIGLLVDGPAAAGG